MLATRPAQNPSRGGESVQNFEQLQGPPGEAPRMVEAQVQEWAPMLRRRAPSRELLPVGSTSSPLRPAV